MPQIFGQREMLEFSQWHESRSPDKPCENNPCQDNPYTRDSCAAAGTKCFDSGSKELALRAAPYVATIP